MTWLPGPSPPCSLLRIPGDCGKPQAPVQPESGSSPCPRPGPIPPSAVGNCPSPGSGSPNSALRDLRRHLSTGNQWRMASAPAVHQPEACRSQPGQTAGSEGWGHTELGGLTACIIHTHFSDVLMMPKGCSPAGTSAIDLGEAREAEGKPIHGPSGMH